MIRKFSVATLLSCAACGGDAGTSVVINELVASNASGLQDDAGAFPDWIELANPGGADASLDGFGLSDDPATPARYEFPEGTTIPGGSYLVLIADGDTVEGDDHLPFRLSAAGESVVLSRLDPDGAIEADQVQFGAQDTDIAWARLPDGDGDWTATSTPTPGAANR